MTATVLIADDQPLMRAALRSCLEGERDLRVVGEASDGAEVVRLARRLRPAVVVMDLHMPILDGIEATRRVVALDGPPVRVLVVTSFDLDDHIVDALRAGASGFMVKDATPEELLHAVRVIAAGQAFLSPAITRRLLDLRAAGMQPIRSEADDPMLVQLTPRELVVLRLIARGLTNTDIATVLDLAPSSVKTHVGHLLTKLGFRDRVHLVVFAYDHGLVYPGGGAEDDGGAGAAVFDPPTAPRGGTAHPGTASAGPPPGAGPRWTGPPLRRRSTADARRDPHGRRRHR